LALLVDSKDKSVTPEIEIEKREKALRTAVERVLPDFVKAVPEADEFLVIHQDAFGVGYNEYELFGMAIKFAGFYGKEVRIIGKNRKTLSVAATNGARAPLQNRQSVW
jgi:hypothetical protein